MTEVSKYRIPEFIYLDDQKVDMALSWIVGSMPIQGRSQKNKSTSKHGGGSLGFQSIVGIQGGLDSTSSEEQEEVTQYNEYSKFARLMSLLQERDGITIINKFDNDIHNQLQRGQIVEIESYISLSSFDTLFRSFAKLLPLIPNQQMDDNTKAVFSLLQQGQSKGIDAFIINEEKPEYRFYTTLLSDKFKASTDELPNTLITLGRITKKLSINESINLSSKYFGGLKIPQDSLQDLVSKFSNDPSMAQIFGGVPSIDDMLVKFPAIGISPIALYR